MSVCIRLVAPTVQKKSNTRLLNFTSGTKQKCRKALRKIPKACYRCKGHRRGDDRPYAMWLRSTVLMATRSA